MTPEESGAESADRARFEAELLEQLQEEIRRLTVADHLLHLMQILPSLAFQHLALTPESQGDRDLAQSRLAIEAFKALLEVVAPLRPADEVGMYRSTLAQMQMAFVAQVERASAPPEDDEVVEADYDAPAPTADTTRAESEPVPQPAPEPEAEPVSEAEPAGDAATAEAGGPASSDEQKVDE